MVQTHRSRQLESLVKTDGTLQLSIGSTEVPEPKQNEVLVRIEAAPINPTDLAVLLASADLASLEAVEGDNGVVVQASIPSRILKLHARRVNKPLVAGFEGAGTVVAAGESDQAQALLGKVVAMTGGAMFSEYRCVPVADLMIMNPGTTAAQAASSIVNPMTALGFIETLRKEGHTAMVHTAAASNLGQMLIRLCHQQDIALVNIVRSPEQRTLLKNQGAEFVIDSSDQDFRRDLTDALATTGATLAFDAVGGGRLGNTVLSCMERAAAKNEPTSHYGTDLFKQLYIYGRLDLAPTELTAAYGFAWNVGGWLMGHFLRRTDPKRVKQLQQKITDEISTTFASHYAAEASFEQVLQTDAIRLYSALSTGNKYLLNPSA
ncbi:MAG: zinc-binding dehydrogenase [Pseudomonadota bacterium]